MCNYQEDGKDPPSPLSQSAHSEGRLTIGYMLYRDPEKQTQTVKWLHVQKRKPYPIWFVREITRASKSRPADSGRVHAHGYRDCTSTQILRETWLANLYIPLTRFYTARPLAATASLRASRYQARHDVTTAYRRPRGTADGPPRAQHGAPWRRAARPAWQRGSDERRGAVPEAGWSSESHVWVGTWVGRDPDSRNRVACRA